MQEKKSGGRIRIKKNSKIVFAVLLSLNLVSCLNTSKVGPKKDIVGNWFISKNTILKNFYYQEAYFDGKEVYFFTSQPNKILFSNGYSYTGDKLAFLANERKDTVNVFSILHHNETLEIKTDKGVIEYTRIKGDKTLSELVSDKISKESYEIAFSKRMKEK